MNTVPEEPRPAEGLLDKIADTALDDDYYVVRSGPYRQSREFNTVLTGAVLAVFALLVAIAAIQTRSDRPATERERTTLINDIDSRKERLAGREASVVRLRTEVENLRTSVVGGDPAYQELRLIASDVAAKGPGVRVRVSSGTDPDTITALQLQTLVNSLWYSGAEAVAVNGKRIGSLTAIRVAAGTIKVNYDPVAAPYEIVALGDADTIQDRFEQTAVGRAWEERGSRAGTSFSVTGLEELKVDAAPKDRLAILHATAIEGDA